MNHVQILIKGIVQGVGFRPFIYNLAKNLDLKGYVKNTSDGVIVKVEGGRLNEFLDSLRNKLPPLARIDDITIVELPDRGYKDFIVVGSVDEGSFTLISPDISICDDCLKELLAPSDRRYLYPFINCTNCGPRYSITQRVPYDRPNTTMSIFSMCSQCLSEYSCPANRRFHAQPNACHECGPQIELRVKSSEFRVNNETYMSNIDTKGNENVIPAKLVPAGLKQGAGIQRIKELDSRLHGNDELEAFSGETLTSLRLTKGHENIIFPLWKRGMKGDFKINESIKSPLTPLCQRGVFSYQKNPIEATIELLKQGAIVAIKGIGGFHLCCDAANEDAVKRLRDKKRRSNKPFAIMSPDIKTIRQFCQVSDEEEKLLTDRRRPIVLLRKKSEVRSQKSEVKKLLDAIAPNNKYLGFMLPYTPLHYLLFYYPLTRHSSLVTRHCFDALVMTSGNLSEEPIVINNDEAVTKLSSVADAFLLHNRDIFMRVDDSVIRVTGHGSRVTGVGFVRRARGYTPETIRLNDDGPDVLGCGADIKNTFTITKGSYAIVSQHIGDMENLETLNFFEETLNNLKQVYRADPLAIAYDLHPNYLSTKWALKQRRASSVEGRESRVELQELGADLRSTHDAQRSMLSFYGIQHHYAHIASVMAEHGLKEKVIGIVFDGTGYGTDGNLWGGEFLICDLNGLERAAHFKYIPLPGGDRAIKECWRTAISYIAQSIKVSKYQSIKNSDTVTLGHSYTSLIWDWLNFIGFLERYGRDKIENALKILSSRQFSPLSSGAGRLFDAVSAITGICDENTFEGEAAIALENTVHGSRFTVHGESYPFEILKGEPIIIDFSKMILHILEDVKLKKDKGLIAAKFHNTLINTIIGTIISIRKKYGIKKVALSGGVFQNEYFLEGTVSQLSSLGFNVHINEKVPCNDAGVSLGQAYIVRERLKTCLLQAG